jgi:hypothetical protein
MLILIFSRFYNVFLCFLVFFIRFLLKKHLWWFEGLVSLTKGGKIEYEK